MKALWEFFVSLVQLAFWLLVGIGVIALIGSLAALGNAKGGL